jgi:hypothetical protein
MPTIVVGVPQLRIESDHPLPSVISILLGCRRSLILTCFVNGMLDSAADISRLQCVRSRKVLSTPLSPCYLVSLSDACVIVT